MLTVKSSEWGSAGISLLRSERRSSAPGKLQFPSGPDDFCADFAPKLFMRTILHFRKLCRMLNTAAWGVWGWTSMFGSAFISFFYPLRRGSVWAPSERRASFPERGR